MNLRKLVNKLWFGITWGYIGAIAMCYVFFYTDMSLELFREITVKAFGAIIVLIGAGFRIAERY